MFVYLTSKQFPPTTADHLYVRSLARAFAQARADFLLVVSGPLSADLAGIPSVSVTSPVRALRTLYYFCWFPSFIASKPRGTTLFANEHTLLAIALLWRPLLGGSYRIVSDWHLITPSWKDRFVARRSDLLIASSKRLAASIAEQFGVRGERIHAVYGGVDPEAYQGPAASRAELGLPEGHLVGYVGLWKSLGHEKGLTLMIDALRHLPEDTHMALVGGTAGEIEAHEAYARAQGVIGRVHLIARQAPERVADYERAMDALVIPYPDLPHFRDYGFPMKTYEYLAARHPIVYANLAILGEVLEGKGKPFTPGDARDLARAILEARAMTPSRSGAYGYSWINKAARILALSERLPC